jgi:catechol 2,3-dioxygenase-like lactoylglutathione lyase family enzyme
MVRLGGFRIRRAWPPVYKRGRGSHKGGPMGVRLLEHFLILTDRPDETAAWWAETLGLRIGDHPDFGVPVCWLYLGDQDVLHIGKRDYSQHQREYLKAEGQAQTDGSMGSGRIDHVCFSCEGLEEFAARLEARGVPFSERQANGQALYQLFLADPINGIKIELNFPAEEARRAGRRPGRTAADAAEEPAAAT